LREKHEEGSREYVPGCNSICMGENVTSCGRKYGVLVREPDALCGVDKYVALRGQAHDPLRIQSAERHINSWLRDLRNAINVGSLVHCLVESRGINMGVVGQEALSFSGSKASQMICAYKSTAQMHTQQGLAFLVRWVS